MQKYINEKQTVKESEATHIIKLVKDCFVHTSAFFFGILFIIKLFSF